MYCVVSGVGNKYVAQKIGSFTNTRFPLQRNRSWTYPWHPEMIYKNGRRLPPTVAHFESHLAAFKTPSLTWVPIPLLRMPHQKTCSSSIKNKLAADWRKCDRHGLWISSRPWLKTSCVVTLLLTSLNENHQVPDVAINLSHADGPPLKIVGYLRSTLCK